MVSTRPRYGFCEGEKVLCYEPDPTKAKVLYDSKIIEIHESRHSRGKKVEYLIHFQGWNPSWDRRVSEDFVLKDTQENRQLQKTLAEKAQLQIGAYLYRKENRKRSSKSGEGKSDDNKSQRKDDLDSVHEPEESYSSSAESVPEEDKVVLRISPVLKELLEFDFKMIKIKSRLTILPAKISVLTILENFVKHSAIRQICGTLKRDKLKRRNSQTKPDKETVLDPEKYANSLNISKEIADGLRIYFNFTLKDHLLYDPERVQHENFINNDFLQTFKHCPMDKNLYLDNFSLKRDSQESTDSLATEDSCRRRLRSYKTEESDFAFFLDNGLSGSESCQSGMSNINTNPVTEFLKSVLPLNATIPLKVKVSLNQTLAWELLPPDAPPEPSMIYGANHLARLIVKLPEFLSATNNIGEEKLRLVLRHLDDFLEYLEEHREWFGEEMYESAK